MSTESSHNDATAQKSQQQYDPDVEYERMKQELMQKRKLEAIVGRQINRRILPFLYGIYTLALFGEYNACLFDLIFGQLMTSVMCDIIRLTLAMSRSIHRQLCHLSWRPTR